MRTRTKILIPVAVFLAVGFFYIYMVENGYSPYVEGIGLTRFSEDEFQKHQKYVKESNPIENLNIVKLTDQELAKVPIIKDLINKSLKKEFPLNRVGILNSTLDEIRSNHDYVAQKYAAKYNTDPGSYFSTKRPGEYQLEQFPDSYWYEYEGRFFKYGTKYYSFYDNRILVNYDEPYRVKVGVLKHDLASDRFYVELTDGDWKHIHKIKQAIDKIGTLQENIDVMAGLSQSDLNKYRQWSQNHTFFEYGGEYYQISFWIA